MAQQVEDVQAQPDANAQPVEDFNEILIRAGVSIPTLRDMAPFRPVPLRPRWLAFLCRLFRVG